MDVTALPNGSRLDDVEQPPEGVADDRLAPVAPGEHLVVLKLEPCQPLVVEAGVADDGGSDAMVRIRAPLLRVEAEPDDVATLEQPCLRRVDLAREVDEAPGAVGEERGDGLLVEPEVSRDRGGDDRRLADLRRVGVHGRRVLADRELDSHAVVHRAAVGRERDRLTLLALGKALERRRLHRLQPRRSREGDAEDGGKDDCEQPDAAVRQPRGRYRQRSTSRLRGPSGQRVRPG